MSCYYPLIGLPRGIVSRLRYSSIPLNQQLRPGHRHGRHLLDLALYRPLEDCWQCIERQPIPEAGDLELQSETYGLSPGELLVAVPLMRDSPHQQFPADLPPPASKRLDRAPVAERCSLSFRWRGIESSYQGEYPLRMAERPGGTLVVFSPLLQSDACVQTNLVAVVTIARRVDLTPHRLEGFEARSLCPIGQWDLRANACTVVEITPQQAATGELFFRCATSLGIPICLSLSRDDLPPSLSVEHTHPPTELFWEQDRLPGSRAIKGSWLGAALR
jgi:hypothetical protein